MKRNVAAKRSNRRLTNQDITLTNAKSYISKVVQRMKLPEAPKAVATRRIPGKLSDDPNTP